MRILLQIFTFLWLLHFNLQATAFVDPTKQSPYFEIKTKDARLESFPLLSTNVISHITGPIADVEVRQRYRNDGTVPIEAVYVFPSSTKAAVYAMEMKIGDRTITAKIQEKNKARKQYQQAKLEGKRTSLLEQNRPNVFTMNVANILPGEQVDLILRYNEFLIPEKGYYQFVFPTVVGPRYSNGIETPDFVSQTAYLSEGTTIPYDVNIAVKLHSPIAIIDFSSPTHNIQKSKINTNSVAVQLSKEEYSKGNRDFIFSYQVSKNEIVSGTTFYDHGDEKFFLSIIEPPQAPETKMITPREFVFIVDVSGSMHGFPIETSKALIQNLLGNMTKKDFFNVILFAGDSQMLSPVPLQASPENISKAIQVVDNQRGGGGTELLGAVKKAMAAPKPYQNTSRSLIIITDGYIHIEADCFDYIQDHLGEANFFAFGIGSNVNRHLIEGIAHVGRGESFVVTEKQFAKETATTFQEYIQAPVLTNIELCFYDFEAYDFFPRHIPDLLAKRPLYVFGKYTGQVHGSILLSGTTAQGKYEQKLNLKKENQTQSNQALRYLWAREKLKYLSDYESLSFNEQYKKDIVNLGLTYNLLSKYTSFIAIDEESVTEGKETKRLRQALPLPQGISQYAIGFEMSATEVVYEDEDKIEDILFIHFDKRLTERQKELTRSFITSQFTSVDQEAKDGLEGNTLTISINKTDGTLSIEDSRQLLDEEQIMILESHILDLIEVIGESVTFNITLLWL